MTDWLALALSELGRSPLYQDDGTKLPKLTKSLENIYFVDFGTIGTRSHDDITALAERTAMALEGDLPACYAQAFAALQLYRLDSIDETRRQRAIADIAVFLDTWGRQAELLGWTAHDIVGHQFTLAALAWVLKGSRVIGLAKRTAYLSDGRTFTRVYQELSHDQH
jgi:hypothetical protein